GALQTGGGLGSPDGQRRFEELKAKTEAARAKYMRERKKLEQPYISKLQTRQEIGGLIGRAVLALLAIVIVSRRLLLAPYLVPLLVLAPYVFAILGTTDWNLLLIGMPVVAALTIGQMSFWGNYLPRVFPLHLRGTGESFAANVGGRMIGTSMAFVTSQLAQDPLIASLIPKGGVEARYAYVAAGVAVAMALIALVALVFLPEPRRDGLPE